MEGRDEKVSAVIVAAGKGRRMGSDIPKQYLELFGKPVLAHTLLAFEKSRADEIVIVCPDKGEEYIRDEIVRKYAVSKVIKITAGGKERFDSCRIGIDSISENSRYVLVHDGARPLVSPELINRVIEYTRMYKACCPGIIPKDTIRISDENGFARDCPARNVLRMIQTPQGFDATLIRKAYDAFYGLSGEEKDKLEITDDAMLIEHFTGEKVYICEGDISNIKITSPGDMATAGFLLGAYSDAEK